MNNKTPTRFDAYRGVTSRSLKHWSPKTKLLSFLLITLSILIFVLAISLIKSKSQGDLISVNVIYVSADEVRRADERIHTFGLENKRNNTQEVLVGSVTWTRLNSGHFTFTDRNYLKWRTATKSDVSSVENYLASIGVIINSDTGPPDN